MRLCLWVGGWMDVMAQSVVVVTGVGLMSTTLWSRAHQVLLYPLQPGSDGPVGAGISSTYPYLSMSLLYTSRWGRAGGGGCV